MEPKQGKLVKYWHVTDIDTAQSGFGQSHIWRAGQSLEATFILCSCFAGNKRGRARAWKPPSSCAAVCRQHEWAGQSLEATFILCSCFAGNTRGRARAWKPPSSCAAVLQATREGGPELGSHLHLVQLFCRQHERAGQSLEATFILCSCFAGNTSGRPDHPGSDSEAGGEGADE